MEGNQSSLGTNRDYCDYCFGSFPATRMVMHEAFCEANPRNRPFMDIPDPRERFHPTPVVQTKSVPLEDEGRNLIVVIGKKESGKTTIVDNLIGEKAVVSPNGEFQNSFRRFTSQSKKYIFIEPNGDIINLISGLSLADIALLVIDCTVDFKATHRIQNLLEECSVAKALGVKQLICCCNKVDLVLFSEEHFNKLKNQAVSYLRELGFNVSGIPFVPISAHEQENINKRTDRLSWYKGFSLLKQLDKFAAKSMVNKALRMVVHTASPLGDITARVHSGWVMTGSDLLFHPGLWSSKLESIRVNGEEAKKVRAWELVDLLVKGPIDSTVKPGSVVSSCEALETPDPVKEALSFTAELLVVDTTLTPGADQYICTVHESEFLVAVSILSCPINRRTGKGNRHAALKAGDVAIVDFAVLQPAVVEKECEYHSLGCVSIRNKDSRKLLAIGVITQVLTELVDILPKPTIGSSRINKLPRGPFATSGSAGKTKKNKNKRR